MEHAPGLEASGHERSHLLLPLRFLGLGLPHRLAPAPSHCCPATPGAFCSPPYIQLAAVQGKPLIHPDPGTSCPGTEVAVPFRWPFSVAHGKGRLLARVPHPPTRAGPVCPASGRGEKLAASGLRTCSLSQPTGACVNGSMKS